MEDAVFTLEQLGLGDDRPDPRPVRPWRYRPGRGERFLAGPLPWVWLQAAGRLPGKALHVGIVLWFECGLARSAEVRLSYVRCAEMGIGRYAAYRALRTLEGAGLVRVRRAPGRCPVVSVLLPAGLVPEGAAALQPDLPGHK